MAAVTVPQQYVIVSRHPGEMQCDRCNRRFGTIDMAAAHERKCAEEAPR